MSNLFNSFNNLLNATLGKNQEFLQLIKAKDIGRAMSQMEERNKVANEAILEYNPKTHNIMKREDKMIFDEEGYYERTEKRWKLPIPYHPFINEIALVFLYGRPIKWVQRSEGTDEAFSYFTQLIEDTRFNSKIRQCKRLAGAETQSAMLFRVFRNRKEQPDVQLRVLAKSKGDDIRVRRDQYENIIDIGWGYYLKEEGKTVLHFDIFTPDIIYRCKRSFSGWEVVEEENLVSKIPIILFQQKKEWDGVENLIEREEFIGSRTADTNDYFADPIAVIDADIVKNMPEKKEESKLLITKGGLDVDKAAKYLTWDNAPASKEKEIEWLQNHIHTKSFTPKIDLESIKGLGDVSAKALKQLMFLADIKAAKHKETHDELLHRTGNLFKAVIGNVLNVSLKTQCEKLIIGHEWQEPFGEDIVEAIKNVVDLVDADLMSKETGVEFNPLIKDHKREMKRLEKEKEDRSKANNDLFRQTMERETFVEAH